LNDGLDGHSNSHSKGSLAEVIIFEKFRIRQSSNSCSRNRSDSEMANQQQERKKNILPTTTSWKPRMTALGSKLDIANLISFGIRL
jgi:hypothetical protein